MLNNDAWSAVAELAASQHGCFTHQQAADNGIGRRRLDRAIAEGLIARSMPRVLRFAGAPPTWRAELWAATHSSGGKASHRATCRLLRYDGFAGAPLEITVARGRLPSLEGVVIHRWTDPEPDLDHVIVDGIPCTTVAATLAQLGAVIPQAAVERALDEALRRGVSLRWIRQTVERLHRPGPSGTGTLIRILADERRSGRLPDSWFERLVQRILLAADIPVPELQHPVQTGPGSTRRLDMAWPELKVGLECHSRRYHFGPLKEAADHRRDLELASVGWEVLYMTWEHRRHPDTFVPLLARTLATRNRQLLRPAA
ncbi:MAG: hypothetical protein OEW83_14810 [Acidimicrobiia bacterium]|nr:hypothetical protein [Acidimicrobiia bacterium]